jgi:multiple sugar transport system ATP-binding protein
VFLFDEPLSNLDAKLRVQMRTEISKLHKKLGATMIYVTHDQVEAMTMGDRIVVLKDGHIQQIDTPLNLYDNPENRFVASFIGSPAMNFVTGKLTLNGAAHFTSADQEISLDLGPQATRKLADYKGDSVILGVRPEDVSISRIGERGQDLVDAGSATLDVVEPMGNEVVLYASTSSVDLVARVVPQKLPQVGDKVSLVFNADRLHFFEPETEQTIL